MVQGYPVTGTWSNEAERLGSAWNIRAVQDMLLRLGALRRPSVRALELTGCCFHPTQV